MKKKMFEIVQLTTAISADIIAQIFSIIISVFFEDEPLTRELKKIFSEEDLLVAVKEFIHVIVGDCVKKNIGLTVVALDNSISPPRVAGVS